MANVVARFEGLFLVSSAPVAELEARLGTASELWWAVRPFGAEPRCWIATTEDGRALSSDEAWALVEKLRDEHDPNEPRTIDHVEPLFETEWQGWDSLDAPDDTGEPGLESAFDSGDFGAGSLAIDWLLQRARVAGLHQTVRGRGVRIAHPDTGYTRHSEVSPRVDETLARGFLADRTALDPGAGFTPFHGTGTASVLISPAGQKPDGAHEVLGVAPDASLVPLRVTDNVVLLSQRALAESIDYARACGCDVVSMSLGGVPSAALHAAIERAVREGMILCAAAGNYSPIPGWPARDPLVIAVGAVDVEGRPWKHSSRGACVAISAPGYGVWRAGWDAQGNELVLRSKGTSFAVATVAGIAALWLEKHGGRAALVDKLGASNVSVVFERLLRRTARPFAPGSNTAGMGAGIVDATALLAADLASAHSIDESIGLESITASPEPAAGTRAAFDRALTELDG